MFDTIRPTCMKCFYRIAGTLLAARPKMWQLCLRASERQQQRPERRWKMLGLQQCNSSCLSGLELKASISLQHHTPVLSVQ